MIGPEVPLASFCRLVPYHKPSRNEILVLLRLSSSYSYQVYTYCGTWNPCEPTFKAENDHNVRPLNKRCLTRIDAVSRVLLQTRCEMKTGLSSVSSITGDPSDGCTVLTCTSLSSLMMCRKLGQGDPSKAPDSSNNGVSGRRRPRVLGRSLDLLISTHNLLPCTAYLLAKSYVQIMAMRRGQWDSPTGGCVNSVASCRQVNFGVHKRENINQNNATCARTRV